MEAHLVRVDPETHTVRVGAAVTRSMLRRLYGLTIERVVSIETVNGVVVGHTYAARPAPPLVLAPGDGAREPGAPALEPDREVAAREAHGHVAAAVGRGGDRHGARP